MNYVLIVLRQLQKNVYKTSSIIGRFEIFKFNRIIIHVKRSKVLLILKGYILLKIITNFFIECKIINL